MARWTRRPAPRNSAGTGRQNALRRARAAWCRCRTREARRTRRCAAPGTPTRASRLAATAGTEGTGSGGPRTAWADSHGSPQSWRARQRRVAPARDRAQPPALGDVAAELSPRERPERPRVPGDPRHLLAQAPPQLGGEAIPGRIGAAEQRHEAHARPTLRQLTRQLERHGAAGAEAGENVRAVRL